MSSVLSAHPSRRPSRCAATRGTSLSVLLVRHDTWMCRPCVIVHAERNHADVGGRGFRADPLAARQCRRTAVRSSWDDRRDEVMSFYGFRPSIGTHESPSSCTSAVARTSGPTRGSKVVWRAPSILDNEPRPRRALPDEEGPPNGSAPGHGHA
jgi:hypothetical protein